LVISWVKQKGEITVFASVRQGTIAVTNERQNTPRHEWRDTDLTANVAGVELLFGRSLTRGAAERPKTPKRSKLLPPQNEIL
jgi:hypothetical protein